MKTTNVYVLGPAGTQSDVAARKALPSIAVAASVQVDEIKMVYLNSHPEVMDAVSKQGGYGIVPISNSTFGYINDTIQWWMKYLLKKERPTVRVVGEIEMRLRYHLLANHWVKTTSMLAAVSSRPEALQQCRKSLDDLVIRTRIESGSTTSPIMEAGIALSRNSLTIGLLGTEVAAELYGLNILKRDMQDNPNIVTRFQVVAPIGHQPLKFVGRSSTALVCTLSSKARDLSEVIHQLVRANCDIRSFHLIQADDDAGKYVYYMEFCGGMRDPNHGAAIAHVKTVAQNCVVLGTFVYDTADSEHLAKV